MTIFIDSDAFVGFVKENDAHHKKVKNLFDKIVSFHIRVISSNYVFSESITVISQKVDHSSAVKFIDYVKAIDGPVQMAKVDEEIENLALEIFKSQRSKNTSFVDCTNIALIRENKLVGIFSFDEVYGKNGIKYLEELL